MRTRRLGGGLVSAATAVLALALSGPAAAAERFAEPNGDGASGAGLCLESDPCSIQTAIEDASVVDGDVVTLLPGTTGGVYEEQPNLPGGSLDINDAITVRSRESDPFPVIPSLANFSPAVFVTDSATLRRLRIDYNQTSGVRRALELHAAGATVERVFAEATRVGCLIAADNVLIRDSVCLATENGNALGMADDPGSATYSAKLRNVTAVGTGGSVNGIFVDAEADQVMTLDAVNTIASGVDDVVAQSEGTTGSDATVTLANSNYGPTQDDVSIDNPGPNGSASITPVGTNGNQTTPPAFANAAGGDFHQLPSSTGTIDLGTGAATDLGTLDLDGDLRSTDGNCDGTATPDIGADELPDADGDLDANLCDNCPASANGSQANHDGDGLGDACDTDDDNDSVADGSDGCSLGAAAGIDTDGDGCKDAGEDPDDDNDNVADGLDNCPIAANANQQDSDGDGTGDACDSTPLPPLPDVDTTAPDTTITDGPSGKTKAKSATFSFSGTDARAVASFQCKLDSGAFEACTSPKTYSKLKKGKHTVEVQAVDTAGNVDPTPASRSWKVKKKKRKK